MVYLSRRYRFSAAHRLHSDALSAEDNRRIYGKCDNPYGHGHNYILAMTVSGAIDSRTGFSADLGLLDAVCRGELVEGLRARRERAHLEVRVRPDHLECLPPDRAGRAEQGDSRHVAHARRLIGFVFRTRRA